nr:MAG TPA: hypothetical protein [Caudoviricetes sp.]
MTFLVKSVKLLVNQKFVDTIWNNGNNKIKTTNISIYLQIL